ncbi:unnamed protein product [Arabis nemorensis]|uniref:Uncharacterized protein n=1 Tax=Arabis nemorensis TaxID=586526 RepID=A0A565CC24_9BRAS|nr:unnamed protein product [Arabis nemorensis]
MIGLGPRYMDWWMRRSRRCPPNTRAKLSDEELTYLRNIAQALPYHVFLASLWSLHFVMVGASSSYTSPLCTWFVVASMSVFHGGGGYTLQVVALQSAIRSRRGDLSTNALSFWNSGLAITTTTTTIPMDFVLSFDRIVLLELKQEEIESSFIYFQWSHGSYDGRWT